MQRKPSSVSSREWESPNFSTTKDAGKKGQLCWLCPKILNPWHAAESRTQVPSVTRCLSNKFERARFTNLGIHDWYKAQVCSLNNSRITGDFLHLNSPSSAIPHHLIGGYENCSSQKMSISIQRANFSPSQLSIDWIHHDTVEKKYRAGISLSCRAILERLEGLGSRGIFRFN